MVPHEFLKYQKISLLAIILLVPQGFQLTAAHIIFKNVYNWSQL